MTKWWKKRSDSLHTFQPCCSHSFAVYLSTPKLTADVWLSLMKSGHGCANVHWPIRSSKFVTWSLIRIRCNLGLCVINLLRICGRNRVIKTREYLLKFEIFTNIWPLIPLEVILMDPQWSLGYWQVSRSRVKMIEFAKWSNSDRFWYVQ